MEKILLSALLVSSLALPAGAQSIQGVLVEPRNPTTSDRIQLTVVGKEPLGCPFEFEEPTYEKPTVVLRTALPDCVSFPTYLFHRTIEIGPLPAGRHYAEVRVDRIPGLTWREVFDVGEDTAQLALAEHDRFKVRIRWSNPADGSSGSGHARRLATDSGAFWFFTPDNLEVTVKVLDGRAVNGNWWVFIASMTDLQLEIDVEQFGGASKTYVQTAGANRNFIDVEAFGEEGPPPPAVEPAVHTPDITVGPERPTPSDPVRIAAAVLNTEPYLTFSMEGNRLSYDYHTYGYPGGSGPPERRYTAEETVGPLAPGVYSADLRLDSTHLFGRTFQVAEPLTQLGLQDTGDSYFNVYVHLDPPLRGVGYGVPLTRESGYFWFFDPDNIELTVKILDGRAVNGKFWVFIASMTDVAYTVEVERCISRSDPFGCGSQLYRGVQGVNQNIIDVNYP